VHLSRARVRGPTRRTGGNPPPRGWQFAPRWPPQDGHAPPRRWLQTRFRASNEQSLASLEARSGHSAHADVGPPHHVHGRHGELGTSRAVTRHATLASHSFRRTVVDPEHADCWHGKGARTRFWWSIDHADHPGAWHAYCRLNPDARLPRCDNHVSLDGERRQAPRPPRCVSPDVVHRV
jgi:hypothetical protein